MADNVPITAGSGTNIATDDAGAGGHVQIIKLAISTDGSATVIPADAANGLDVDVTRLPALVASTAAIGKLAANSGVDIGDVDVTSVPADPFGTNADAAVAAGATGSIQAKLRRVTQGLEDLKTLIVLGAGSALIGKVNLDPRTSGGYSVYKTIDLDETEEDVKTSAGQLYGYYFANMTSSWRYLKLYNATAASVTVGTTTPVLTYPLPPLSAGHVFTDVGVAFSTAICGAVTTGIADNDTGAPGTNDVAVMFYYT